MTVGRTHAFSLNVLRQCVLAIEHGLSSEQMPSLPPLRSLWPKVKVPAFPEHTLARSSGGDIRSVRCLLPHDLLNKRAWVPVGSRTHTMCAIGCGTVCVKCGAYAFARVRQLGGACKGRPADVAATWRLRRMDSGRHPVCGVVLGMPRLIEPALETFHLILGED